MFTRGHRLLWWVIGTYALIVFLHAGASEWLAGGTLLFRWAYGTGYFLLGVLGYAALRRARPGLDPAFGRALALLGGAGLSGLDAFLLAPPAGGTRLELWMTALLGFTLAVISARFAPAPFARAGTEGRTADGAGRRGAD